MGGCWEVLTVASTLPPGLICQVHKYLSISLYASQIYLPKVPEAIGTYLSELSLESRTTSDWLTCEEFYQLQPHRYM